MISAPGWSAVLVHKEQGTIKVKLPLTFWALIATGDDLTPVGMVQFRDGVILPATDASEFGYYEYERNLPTREA